MIPVGLVGTWDSAGGDAELIYQFDADGKYRHAGVLIQQRPGGLFQFQVAVAGTMSVDGKTLVLRPLKGTKTTKDPDSPNSNSVRPYGTTPESYRWTLTSDRLALTDNAGSTISYHRQR